MSYKRKTETDEDRMSVFTIDQIIKLTPYDHITETLGLAIPFRIKSRDGVFITLEHDSGMSRDLVTRIAIITNPRSEVINPSGFCPCYAYDYDADFRR